MRILFITAEGFDSKSPNNQMAEVMLNDFLNAGHEVHLIQSSKQKLFPEIPDSLKNREHFTYETIDRKNIDRTNFVKRYLNEVHYTFQSMRRWIKCKGADVIYVQSNPVIVFTLFFLRCFKPKTPVVYSIYDVFPGHAYDIGVIKSKLVYRLLKYMQWPSYKLSTAILVLSTDMKRIVEGLGAKSSKVHVVPAWYDVSSTREIPDRENQFMRDYGINRDKFIVQFAGTIGYVFNYKTIIELAKRLKNDIDIQLQMIGDGNVKHTFKNKANELGLDNIKFYPLQPIKRVPDVYSTADVCIIPLMKGVIGNGVPSKTAILMACRRVILSSVEQDSDYARMFAEKNMGISVDIEDYDKLADAVRYLKNNPDKVKIMVENAYQYGKSHYSSTRSTKLIMDVFESVAKRK